MFYNTFLFGYKLLQLDCDVMTEANFVVVCWELNCQCASLGLTV